MIKDLIEQNTPIDAFGIGTAVVTGKDEGALDGVYKLAQVNNKPTMKMSENISKITFPGIKKIYHYVDNNNLFYADGIELHNKEFKYYVYSLKEFWVELVARRAKRIIRERKYNKVPKSQMFLEFI